MEVAALVGGVLAGDRRAVARAISAVEDDAPELAALSAGIYGKTGGATTIGLTGAPGVGKSTLAGELVRIARDEDLRAAVLAVDPTSPYTGGALLGDRVRMQDHAVDPGVFIRSMAGRGHLGGLSWAAPHAARALDAAGFDTVLVETVGVGQAEVEIASHADTTVVLLAPGGGDGVQVAKAGVLEIADIYVVNKADHDGAKAILREVREMVGRAPKGADTHRPAVLEAVAAQGRGIDDLVHHLDEHRSYLDGSGLGLKRRRDRARCEIEALAMAELQRRLVDVAGLESLQALAEEVAEGRLDPYGAAARLLKEFE
jgi:LAO/AO transport system kinase